MEHDAFGGYAEMRLGKGGRATISYRHLKRFSYQKAVLFAGAADKKLFICPSEWWEDIRRTERHQASSLLLEVRIDKRGRITIPSSLRERFWFMRDLAWMRARQYVRILDKEYWVALRLSGRLFQ